MCLVLLFERSVRVLSLHTRALDHFLKHMSTEIFITAHAFDVVFTADLSLFK